MQDFSGKTAVVTGAAGGIGLAMAKLFLANGLNVVMADVEAHTLNEAADALKINYDGVLAAVVDVSDASSVDALADASYEAFGAVHILCNNAGVFVGGASWESTSADYRWLLEVNVLGVANGIRSFVPRMIEQGVEGHIVNTTSMAALTTMPFSSVYCTSKAAALSLSECLYKELQVVAPQIGVSVLCPELINTGIASADRNRPAAYSKASDVTDTEFSQIAGKAIAEGTGSGLDPMVMAERVMQGIKDDKFYLLAEDGWKSIAMTRQDEIREEKNPTLAMME